MRASHTCLDCDVVVVLGMQFKQTNKETGSRLTLSAHADMRFLESNKKTTKKTNRIC
jgi:hypothetical protein